MPQKVVFEGTTVQYLILIERLREELYDTYIKFGNKSPLVLLKSQELDSLLNRYHGLLREI